MTAMHMDANRARLSGLAAVVLVATGGAIAFAHQASAHAGEHFVAGHADPDDVTVKLWRPGRLELFAGRGVWWGRRGRGLASSARSREARRGPGCGRRGGGRGR